MMPIFYMREMAASAPGFGYSAAKPIAATAAMLEYAHGSYTKEFAPVDREILCLAHSSIYVRRVLDCIDDNGFGNRDPKVAASLPYTVGSMLAAAEWVVSRYIDGDKVCVACSPTSGFHHAHFDYGGGFCTFNGLMVAAIKLSNAGVRVAILDGDAHYGDGTADIWSGLPLGTRRNIRLWSRRSTLRSASAYLEAFRSELIDLAAQPPGVVLYQAGADMLDIDPLGAGLLTEEQLAARDSLVFKLLAQRSIPVAWNLAGGYATDDDGSLGPVLRVHANTARIMVGRGE